MNNYVFELNIRYADATEINAKGYEKYPTNYQKGHKKLSEYLEKIK